MLHTPSRYSGVTSILAAATSGALLVKILGAGLELSVQILVARLLGATQYGIYLYVLTCVGILAVASTMGLDIASIRFVASYKATQKWSLLHGVVRRSLGLTLPVSLIAALTVVGVAVYSTAHTESVFGSTFLVAAPLLPFLVLSRLRQATLRGLRHVVRADIPELVVRPVLLASTTIAFYLYFSEPVYAVQVMLFNAVATMAAFLLGTMWLIRFFPQPARHVEPVYKTRHWLSISASLLSISGMQIVISHTDIVMIGLLLDAKSAGVYGASSRIAGLVTFGLMAVNAIMAPMISECYSLSKHEQLQHLLTLAARGAFVFALIVVIGLVVFGRPLLHLFGDEFEVAYVPLLILSAGQTINALAGSVGFLMTMTEHHVEAAWILGSSAVLNVLLNAHLIPLFDINGAAIATAVSIALWNVGMLIYVRRRMKLNPTIFRKL